MCTQYIQGDLTGCKIGRLTVLEKDDTKNNKRYTYWRCMCECGSGLIKSIREDHLRKQETLSCGCLVIEKRLERKIENSYVIEDNIVRVQFANTENYFICDIDDWEKYCHHSWYENEQGYAMSRIKGKLVRFHRLVMGANDGDEIDHRNRNKYDNRKSNLRFCSHHENMCNVDVLSSNTSGAKGVYLDKRTNKWIARIVKDKHCYHLGVFEDKKDAIAARKHAELALFGEFSPLFEIKE